MAEETGNNRTFFSKPLSIEPKDWARIERMAQSHQRSTSAQIRSLVMPQVEAWEREQGLPPVIEQE